MSGESTPTGLPHCALCGVLWDEHEVDPYPGPLGLKVWVCRLPEDKFDELLEWMEDENNWGSPDALSKREATQIHVGEASEDRSQMDQEVRFENETEETA